MPGNLGIIGLPRLAVHADGRLVSPTGHMQPIFLAHRGALGLAVFELLFRLARRQVVVDVVDTRGLVTVLNNKA